MAKKVLVYVASANIGSNTSDLCEIFTTREKAEKYLAKIFKKAHKERGRLAGMRTATGWDYSFEFDEERFTKSNIVPVCQITIKTLK